MPQIRFQRHLNSAYQKRIFSSWQGTGPTECAFARPLTPEHGRWPERRRFAQWQREIAAACGFPFIQPLYSTRKDTTDSVFVACMSEESSNRGPGSLRISVAMATYNGAKHIREQLDSIARQTLLPFELVITDDGSTDATLQIAEEFARNAPFTVRIFRNEKRLGYADNFLKAASICEGELIAFCDQDDVWLEHKLDTCCRFFSDPDVALAAHSAVTISECGVRGYEFPRFPRTRVAGFGSVDPFVYPYGFAIVVRRNLVDIKPGASRPEKLFAHDQWFWFLAAATGKTAIIAEVLALYRQHGNNLFGAFRPPTLAGQTKRLARTMRIVGFDGLADSELACARFLSSLVDQGSEWHDKIMKFASMLEFRSKLHRMRTRIYGEKSTIGSRASTFVHILLLGGYFPDPSGTRLGFQRGAKDLMLGVTGTYRLFSTTTTAVIEEKAE
jgi:glycosyltransferase involved in cell wall biosynthesis